MKKLLTLLLLFSLTTLWAQKDHEYQTIFGKNKAGGYGSFGIGYTIIDTSQALTFSSRGGIILGHTLALGIGGAGFVTEYKADAQLNMKGSLAGGYGGVFLEIILFGKSPVHLSVPVLAGFGGAAYTTWQNEGTEYSRVNTVEDVATFLVLEPGVELEFNISRHIRAAAYVNYRYTSNLDITSNDNSGLRLPLVNPKALNAYSAGVVFKFGKF